MAILQQGSLGLFTGKIGALVITKWKSKYVTLPPSFAGEVQVWLFFLSDDLKFVSETEHLGEFTISP